MHRKGFSSARSECKQKEFLLWTPPHPQSYRLLSSWLVGHTHPSILDTWAGPAVQSVTQHGCRPVSTHHTAAFLLSTLGCPPRRPQEQSLLRKRYVRNEGWTHTTSSSRPANSPHENSFPSLGLGSSSITTKKNLYNVCPTI